MDKSYRAFVLHCFVGGVLSGFLWELLGGALSFYESFFWWNLGAFGVFIYRWIFTDEA